MIIGRISRNAALVCASTALLSGCFGNFGSQDQEVVTRQDYGPALQASPTQNDTKVNAQSAVIADLIARRSILPRGGPYDEVVTSVLNANARAAEADLEAARLRAQAASKNWLPTIGPSISLNSLGDVVSQIIVDQVLFDNGRKKGERAYAQADVEHAAVALAEATNDRAATALNLYLKATEARELASLHRATLKKMQHFQYVMQRRVNGGVSDPSDVHVLSQKVAEINAAILSEEEAELTTLAELNAMSTKSLAMVRGIEPLSITVGASTPLSVKKAMAEQGRQVASAKIDRANQLPTLSASAALGENSGAGLGLGGAAFGLGTGARLASIKAAEEAAQRRVSQATEDANRKIRSLAAEVAALNRQAADARSLTERAQSNLSLFQRQYEGGQRTVMDVMGVYEIFAVRNASEVSLKYEALRKTVELARLQGVLANGDEI